jgi:hypothetical protein
MGGVSAVLLSGLAQTAHGDGDDATATPPPVRVSYVYPRWQDDAQFRRISEYFTGRENTGGDIVVRTHSPVRSGLYFRIGLPVGTQFPAHSTGTVEYIRSDSPDVRTHVFDLPALSLNPFTEICLGLTGESWPKRDLSLVAWRFTLKDNTGAILARRQSFLWALPASRQ